MEIASWWGNADWWVAIATVFLAVITGVLARYTYLLWRDASEAGKRQAQDTKDALSVARDSANAAKRSADASLSALRPWLSFDVCMGAPLVFDESGDAFFPIEFTIRNVGGAPAFDVNNFFPQINFLAPNHELSIAKLQRLAIDNRGLPARGGGVLLPGGFPLVDSPGLILFPGQKHIERIRFQIPKAALDAACADLPDPKVIWPELVALITYSYALAEVRADTGCVFEITNRDGKPLMVGQDLAPEDVCITRHIRGGLAS